MCVRMRNINKIIAFSVFITFIMIISSFTVAVELRDATELEQESIISIDYSRTSTDSSESSSPDEESESNDFETESKESEESSSSDSESSEIVDESETSSSTPKTRLHSWSSPGTYQVKVRAKDIHGGISDWSSPYTVNINYEPVSDFTYTPSDPNKGDSINFVSNSYDPDGDNIVRYDWWYNGLWHNNKGSSISLTYYIRGQKTVKLRVHDEYGATSVEEKTITIN